MATEGVKATIDRFLANRLKVQLGEDDPIFESGRVNSLFAMQLVLFIEKEFGLSIDSDDLEMKNFESIASIVRLVAQKQGRA